MPKRVSKVETSTDRMTTDQREKLAKTMIELVGRGPAVTAIVVRLANAGGLTEVVDYVKRMRIMVKRFGGFASAVGVEEDEPAPRKRKGKKKRTKLDFKGSDPEGTKE